MNTVTISLLLAAMFAAQAGPTERQRIDNAAADRGRLLYTQYCINCHGSTAKGTDRGPDLIRSAIVLRDRLGNGIGPAARKGPDHQAHQATLTDPQVVDLSHFLHQRVESIASNRNARGPLNVVTGNAEAGRAYFNGAGKCSTCHSPTGDLAGIATRIPVPVNLQQRFLFPALTRGGPKQVEVTVTPGGGKPVSGALVRIDGFQLEDGTAIAYSFELAGNDPPVLQEVDDTRGGFALALEQLALRSRVWRLLRVKLHDLALERDVARGRGVWDVSKVEGALSTQETWTVRRDGRIERFTHQREAENQYADDAQVEARAQADYAAMAGIARAAGVQLVLVEYPLDLGMFAAANRAMQRVGAELGVPLVDSTVSQARVPDAKRQWLWAGHPNGAIYEEIARDAAAALLKGPS
jgi:mono/diheme cytochrome c family protein